MSLRYVKKMQHGGVHLNSGVRVVMNSCNSGWIHVAWIPCSWDDELHEISRPEFMCTEIIMHSWHRYFYIFSKKVILFDQCRRLKNDYNCLTKVFIPEIPQGLKNVKFPNGNCFPRHLESKVQRTLSSTMRSFKETNTYDFTDFTY